MRLSVASLAAISCLVLLIGVSPANGAKLIASPKACPKQTDAAAPRAVQERAIRCMVNYARSRSGLRKLKRDERLGRSARRKSLDMVRCKEFDHEACGREFTHWIKRFGYAAGACWQAAENIAWGTGEFATPRAIFTSWMRSSGHRANILRGSFRDLGVGLKVGSLEGHPATHIWTQHFGARC